MNKRFIVALLLYLLGVQINAQTFDSQKDTYRKNYIHQFIDTYKQAYQLMDIDYIETLFSEDALVITEGNKISKVQEQNTFKNVTLGNKNEYERIIENKAQYLSRLKKIFKDNIAIRLSLANLKIHPHIDYPEIYGVSFLQVWKSMEDSSISIEDNFPGYIFMMIDFKNGDDSPIIHVRTWQPEDHIKEPKDIYHLYDFVIL
jgi:hypothetical protein